MRRIYRNRVIDNDTPACASVSRVLSESETFDMGREELIPCSACPDGYVWTANGPTSAACPICLGWARLKRDGSPCDEALRGAR